MRGTALHTYSFFVHQVGSSPPTLMFEVASDEVTLQALAEKALAASPDHLAVEILEDDRLVFSLDRNGATWPVKRDGLSG
jgi:hypothetical protein